MTESIAERAFCAIEKKLKAIREADGYKTDAGLHVFRARRSVSKDELPAAVLWDAGETPEGDNPSGDVTTDMQVNIEVHGELNGEQTGKLIERMKGDVKRALFGNGNKYGHLTDDIGNGKIGAIGYHGAQCFPREEGATTESITMKFVVRFKENLGDPYNAA